MLVRTSMVEALETAASWVSDIRGMAEAISCTDVMGDAFDLTIERRPVSVLSCDASFVTSSAMAYDDDIRQLALRSCSRVGQDAFFSCSSLRSVYLPACVVVGVDAFARCASLASVSLPNCETLDASAFAECTTLSYAYLPKCSSVGEYAFLRCGSLGSVALPKCSSVGTYAFLMCSSLGSVALPKCNSIGDGAFYGCSKLSVIDLTEVRSVPVLASTRGFLYTPLAAYPPTGSIYVPSSLYSQFMSASNWSYYSDCMTSEAI